MHSGLFIKTLLLVYSFDHGFAAGATRLGSWQPDGFGEPGRPFEDTRKAREKRSIRLGSVQGALDFITNPSTSSFLIPQFIIGVCEENFSRIRYLTYLCELLKVEEKVLYSHSIRREKR